MERSRRQTLAPVSPSQLNAKAAGNTAAPGPARNPKESALPAKARKSVAPGLHAERPSAIGLGIDRRGSALGSKPGGSKTDHRPLSNKEYQAACGRRIIAYLVTHNFPGMVTPKTLASPTAKEFVAIVTFLLQQVDPALKIQGKIEDDVPAYLKRLNYPFQISKSALFAVGAPHTWPPVLGALTWLVELLEYTEAAEAITEPSFGVDKTQQDLFEYIAAGYDAFMNGDDDRCNQLDEQQVAKFAARREEQQRSIDELRKENAELQAQLDPLRSQRDPVVEATEKRDEKLSDMQKFQQLIEGLQNMKQTLTRKLAERKADLEAKQEQIAAAMAEVGQLQQRVASQTLNKADVNRMMMDRKKQKEILNAESAKCAEMEDKVHEQEVQILRSLTSLESSVERYNKLAHRLKLIPATSKRADGFNYELRVNRDAVSQADFSSLDLKGAIKPGLERLCASYRQRATQLNQDLISLKEAHTARLERNMESKEQSAVLEGQIAKLEAQLQAAKDAQEEKSRRLLSQAEAIQAEVDQDRNAASKRTESMEERLGRAQDAFEQVKRDVEAELAQLESDLKQALHMLVAHKEAMTSTIMQTARVVRQVKEELQVVPTARRL